MKMYNINLVRLAVVIGGILAVPVASAAEPVDISSNITIDSAISCALTVTPENNAVALNYTVTPENVSSATAGTYSPVGEGTANYVISVGSEACAIQNLSIRMPVVGSSSGAYAVALYKGSTKFLVNTFVADLYATDQTNGSGVPSAIVGAGMSKVPNVVSQPVERLEAGYVMPFNPYDTNKNSFNSTDIQAPAGAPVVFSDTGKIRVPNPISDTSVYGWPSGWGINPRVNGYAIPTGFIKGVTGGSYVVIPATSLTGQRSVTIKVGTAVSTLPYTQKVADVGGVVNGETFSGTGTLTVTSS